MDLSSESSVYFSETFFIHLRGVLLRQSEALSTLHRHGKLEEPSLVTGNFGFALLRVRAPRIGGKLLKNNQLNYSTTMSDFY